MVRSLGLQTHAGAVIEPQTSLLGCLAGTFSPSRRQIRSTLLWFTSQPSILSRAVTLR